MRVVGADSFARFLAGGSTASLLELGDAGPTVRAWQRSLDVWRAKTTSPIVALTPDGSFGPTTQVATEALQASANLVPDGVVGAPNGSTRACSGERTDAAGPVLARLATEAERNLVALDDVKPPGRLLATSRYAQQSLELRALALRTIVHLLDGTKGGPSVALLAAQGRRLLASDVIWHDLVQDATTRSLADAGIAGRAGSGIAFPV